MARLSLLDSAFVLFESDARPLHVSGMTVLVLPDPAQSETAQPDSAQPEAASYADRLYAELISDPTVLPPFNKTVQISLTGLPKWKTLSQVNLTEHVIRHTLPAPGSREQLMSLVGEIHGQKLDRRRPLWEFHIIDGLERGRVATVAKVHHSIGDGFKLTQITRRFLSTDPQQCEVTGFWRQERSDTRADEHSRRQQQQLVERALGVTSRAWGHLATLPGMAMLSASSLLKFMNLKQDGVPLPFTAPKTPFNFTQRQGRTVVGIDFPLATFRRLSRLTGASINDIALTLSDMALNQYLKENRWQLEKPLIALMPVNLKSGDSTEDNLFSPALIELGGRDISPGQRLAAIQSSSRNIKSEAVRFSQEAYLNFSVATSLFNLLQGTLKLNEILPAASNLIISNVPGPTETRYLMGAKVESIYPFGVLTPAQTLNITLFSYDGRLHFGLNACRSSLPGLEKLLSHHQQALEWLERDVFEQATSAVNHRLGQIDAWQARARLAALTRVSEAEKAEKADNANEPEAVPEENRRAGEELALETST